MASAAFADSISTDGDTLMAGSNISYGAAVTGNTRLCSTRGTAVAGEAQIKRTGTEPNLVAGETVTLALTSPNAGIVVSGGTGTVPTPWSGGADFTIATSTTVAAGVADGDYAINATATGGTSGAVLTDSFTVTVSCTVAPPADTTAPSAAAITIDDGAAWTNSATGSVTLDLSGTDNVGITKYRLAQSQAGLSTATDVAVSPAQASFSALNIPFTLTGAEAASKSVWLRVYDAAGQSLDASDAIGWDYTAPNVLYTSASGTAGTTAPWYTSNVVATFTAEDNVSGFGSAGSLTTTATATTSGEGSAVTVSSPAFTDNAGNTRAAGAASQSFSIDLSNPAVAITSPTDGHTTIAASILVSGTASDAISGLASVDVNGGAAAFGTGTFSKSGVALACGANTITATATDIAGRTNRSSITVNRTCFSGIQFYQPLDQTTPTSAVMINAGRYGRVIPVKVTFSVDGGTRVTQETLAANGWTVQIGANGVSCDGGEATDTVEAYADAGTANSGSPNFRWDSTSQQWVYNLDTKAPPSMTMAINNCYRLDVYVSDGTNRVKVSTTTYAIFKPVK